MLDKKRKRLFLLAVYLIIVITSIALLLWGYDPEVDSPQGLAVNLATELFSVAFVFFLVDYIFTIGDWDLSERVTQLVDRLQQTAVSASIFFQMSPDLEPYIRQAQQIDLCGVTLSTTINKKFVSLRQQIMEGANVRILIIGETLPILTMAAQRSEDAGNTSYYRKRLATALDDIIYLQRNVTEASRNQEKTAHSIGSLQIRVLSYAPSFSIISFDPDQKQGIAFVEIYPHHTGYNNTPQFQLTPEKDGEWYQYFTNQFEAMWQSATEWRPVEGSGESPINTLLAERARTQDFFLPENYLSNDLFAQADEIYLSGYSLSRTVRQLTQVISNRLADGAQIKIVLVDPENGNLLQQMARESVAATADTWRSSIQATLALLNAIAHNPDNKGSLEIGLLPFTPSFGLKFIDPHTLTGLGFVELYHHKANSPNATFALKAEDDAQWYPFFREQFEELWNTCRYHTFEGIA
jgi:hypothetical protein